MGTMLMGVSTQLFHTSKAGVAAIAGIIAVGFVLFGMQKKETELENEIGEIGIVEERV